MRYEWDETKRQINVSKHGFDFVGCEAIFEGDTLTVEDDRVDYGERRFVTLGLLQGRAVAVTHTETEHVIRIISVRKATRREQTSYFQALPN
jgi:uncharacterized DUF497 family protein